MSVLISAAAHSVDAARAIVTLCDSLFSFDIAVEVSTFPPPLSIHESRLQSC